MEIIMTEILVKLNNFLVQINHLLFPVHLINN